MSVLDKLAFAVCNKLRLDGRGFKNVYERALDPDNAIPLPAAFVYITKAGTEKVTANDFKVTLNIAIVVVAKNQKEEDRRLGWYPLVEGTMEILKFQKLLPNVNWLHPLGWSEITSRDLFEKSMIAAQINFSTYYQLGRNEETGPELLTMGIGYYTPNPTPEAANYQGVAFTGGALNDLECENQYVGPDFVDVTVTIDSVNNGGSSPVTGNATFTGTGTNDLTFDPTSVWTEAPSFSLLIKIASVGSGGSCDYVVFSFDNGGTWSDPVPIGYPGIPNVGYPISAGDAGFCADPPINSAVLSISLEFGAINNHTIGDQWAITHAPPVLPYDTFAVGTATGIQITGGWQAIPGWPGLLVSFGSVGGHVIGDSWRITGVIASDTITRS